MDAAKAKDCIREFANRGCFQPTKHCRERMVERGVTIDDVLNVMLWGNITEINYDEAHDSYKCKIEGFDIEKEPLTFIAAIYEYCHTVRCITVC